RPPPGETLLTASGRVAMVPPLYCPSLERNANTQVARPGRRVRPLGKPARPPRSGVGVRPVPAGPPSGTAPAVGWRTGGLTGKGGQGGQANGSDRGGQRSTRAAGGGSDGPAGGRAGDAVGAGTGPADAARPQRLAERPRLLPPRRLRASRPLL